MTTAFMNFGQTDGFGVAGREGDRDGRTREVFMSDGNSAILEARDPYGHWYIRWKDGKTPDEFKSNSFTSPDSAKKFLDVWLNKNRYNTKPVENKVAIPELKTKGK